jgi:hypothetical protein
MSGVDRHIALLVQAKSAEPEPAGWRGARRSDHAVGDEFGAVGQQQPLA